MNPPSYPLDNNLESGQDLWNPNILASTNWLEAIDLDGFDTALPAFLMQEGLGLNMMDGNLSPEESERQPTM